MYMGGLDEEKFTKKIDDYIKDGTYMINLDTDKIC